METRVQCMRWRVALALNMLLIAAFIGVGTSATAQGVATITTDLDDYPPGATAIITGSGFQAGEEVILQVEHVGDDPLGTDPETHQPWSVNADDEGNVSTSWYVPIDGDALGATFLLTADGQLSGLHAEWTFTDGDGDGKMSASPLNVCTSSSGNNIILSFKTVNGTQGVYDAGSFATVSVPVGWTAPQTSAPASPGYVSVTAVGSAVITAPSPSVSGSGPWTITINFTSSSGTTNGFDVSYANVTAPTVASATSYQFTTATKKGTGTQLKNLSPANNQPSITVQLLPVAGPTGVDGSRCGTGTVALSASMASGTVDWYATPTGGIALANATNNFTTPSISATTIYYAEGKNSSGCAFPTRTAVTATVSPVTVGGSVSGNATVCSGSNSGTLTLSGQVGNITKWQASPDINFVSNVTDIGNPTTSQPYANLTQSTYFRAVVQSGSCAVANSSPALITVSAPTASITGTALSCSGNNVPLTIAVTGTGPWSGTLSNGQAFSGNSSPITVSVNPTVTTTYTVATLSDASCSAIAAGLTGSAVITVRPALTASITTAAPLAVCPGQTKIDFAGTPMAIITYNDGVSDQTVDIKNNGTASISPNLAPGVYTYTLVKVSYATAPTCETLIGSAITITVNTPPSITSQPSSVTTTYGNGGISFSSAAVGTGITYQWLVNTGGGFANVPNNSTYSGATTNVLNVNNPTASMNGFTYQVRVTGVCNPNATSNTVSLTVNKAALTVTADNKAKVYGAADPALTYTPSGTLFYGDAYSVITGVTLSTTTGAAATAGTHVITATGGVAANYNITRVNGTLTVDKAAALTVTADDKTKVYGAIDPTLTYTPSGTLYYGDSYGVITGVTLSTATGAAATVGTHVITALGGVAANYNVNHVNGTLTVDKASLTVTADDKSKVYGGADPSLTFTPSGTLFYGDSYSVITGITLSTTTGAAATAGTHVITATGGVASNYNVNHVNGTLTVDKAAALTVTADDKNKVYGAADPGLTFTPSGTLYYGDSYNVITGVTLSTANGAAATAGTHVITASGGIADNYNVNHVNGTLTVGKAAALTVTADDQSKVYGAADPTLTYSASGTLFYGDQYNVITGVSLSTATGAAATAGTHVITASGGVADNYNVNHVNGTLTVDKAAALTVTADDQNKVYGAADPTLTYTPSGTLFYGDSYSVITGVTLSTATGAAATTGTHVISASGGVAANYNVNHIDGTLTVGKADLTVTADDQSKVYGAVDPTLTYTPSGTLFYGDSYSVITGVTLSTATGAAATAGTHVITASGGVADNYNVNHVNGTLTVGKADLTVTAEDKSKVYGAADPTLTYTVSGTLFYGDQNSVISGVTLSTTMGAAATVGTHPITATGGIAANYNVNYVNGTLTVSKASLTVTADNKSKVYGAVDPALTYAPSGTLFYGDQYTVITGVTLSTNTGALATAGTHVITAANGVAANYDVIHVNGTLTVSKADLTATANNKNKVYGGVDPTLTYTASGALFYGDSYSVITGVTLGTATGAAATAGTHVITASGGVAANYNVNHVNGTLTVGKADLTVTADDKSKVYGAADPTLSYTASGTLFYTDNYSVISGVTLSTTIGAAATVGTHPITATGGAAANYNVNHVNGTLTVSKASLTVTADNKSKVYGALDPTLTYTPSGTLFYGDQYTVITGVTLSTNTGALATAGTHVITAANGVAANYDVIHVNGTLTVSKAAALIVTADNKSKVYGAADPTLTYTATGTLYYSDMYGVISGVTLSAPTAAAATAGTHTITAANGSAANYNVTHANGTLTVTKAPALLVTADNKTKVYGAAEPTLTYTPSGTLYYTDTYSVITGVTLSAPTGAAATVGTHVITAANGVAANYYVNHLNGTLTVTQATLTITANNKSKYCGQNVTFAGTEFTTSGLKYSDVVTSVTLTSAGAPWNALASGAPYSIVPSAPVGSGLANYTIGYVNGTLSITAVSIDASANSNPQPVKSTSTVVNATITPAVAGVYVTFKVDGVVKGTSQTNASGVASFDIGVLPVEVYKIEAIAGADCSNSIAYLPVYDPTAGFVTGGGWFISPVVTTLPYMQASGKANFGFVSKYLKGSNTPTGNTEFQFQAGNLNFASSTYDAGSLVVTNTKAIYKGVGTINGGGNYGFMVSALDGDATGGGGIDKFRIKIWDKGTNAIVYDNNAGLDENGVPTTALGGGSIVIHNPGGKNGSAREANEATVESTPIQLDETISIDAYPNPMRSTLSVKVSNPSNQAVSIHLIDNIGRTMVLKQPDPAPETVVTIDTEQWPSGLYILQVKVGRAGKTMKLLKE